MFNIKEIMKYVPHRYPFLLIDRVIDFVPNQSVKVVKNVTVNEAHFMGHFPENPIMPGVYIVENMAQAACFLLAKSGDGLQKGKVYVLGKIIKCSFMHPVVPGDQLITIVNIEKIVGDMSYVSAKATVEDKVVAKGELLFGMIDSEEEK